ncbi:MAG: MgtC/SapB family protein [bacterium]|nr:MgtC/SapB family protein [bacterium]
MIDPPDDVTLAWRLGAALALGLLLGLERERAREPDGTFGGVRTFALVTLLGALCAVVQTQLGLPAIATVAFVGLAALLVTSYVATSDRGHLGLTSEITALLAFLLGTLCGSGWIGVAAMAAVASVLLLTLKGWLHRLARHVEPADVEATLKFAIITVVVLPLLPDRPLGPPPFDVLNPQRLWWMVVLIAGVDFVGYVLVKVLGSEHGLGLTGLLGGLVSSTASTLGLARRSRDVPQLARDLALAVLLAWSVMLVRVWILVCVAHPPLAAALVVPLGAMGVASAAICAALWWRTRPQERGNVAVGANPFELTTALRFGAVYALVLIAVRVAEQRLGDGGLYLAGALAGLTDTDAVALSMASLTATTPAALPAAARTVLIAVLANTATKTALCIALGAPGLRRAIVPAALVLALAGAAAGWLGPWP